MRCRSGGSGWNSGGAVARSSNKMHPLPLPPLQTCRCSGGGGGGGGNDDDDNYGGDDDDEDDDDVHDYGYDNDDDSFFSPKRK